MDYDDYDHEDKEPIGAIILPILSSYAIEPCEDNDETSHLIVPLDSVNGFCSLLSVALCQNMSLTKYDVKDFTEEDIKREKKKFHLDNEVCRIFPLLLHRRDILVQQLKTMEGDKDAGIMLLPIGEKAEFPVARDEEGNPCVLIHVPNDVVKRFRGYIEKLESRGEMLQKELDANSTMADRLGIVGLAARALFARSKKGEH